MDISSLRERRDLNALTVSELNNMVKGILDNAALLQRVLVCGELSNVNMHTSGHVYFTLKDSESQIKCIMFRSAAQSLRFIPKEGMRVVLSGTVSVYTKGGSYQIYATSMQPDGVGALYLAYNELKDKLEREGLFSKEHKKTIPEFPRRIGVITSPTGAAVRDIIHVCGRRFPLAHIFLYPSLVQGDGAEENLLCALEYFEKSHLVDVIIIGRGGGSIEDLWAFNSENLARKIYELNIPVISAVGHETDFTICDFVADMRAPTPSAAAEVATPDLNNVLFYLDELSEKMRRTVSMQIESLSNKLESLTGRPVMKSAEGWLLAHHVRLNQAKSSLDLFTQNVLQTSEGQFALVVAKLEALSPLAVLRRGYSIVQNTEGTPVSSIEDVSLDDELDVRLSDGRMVVRVIKK